MATGDSPNTTQVWFTNDFLEQVLKRSENDDSLMVTKININNASEKGDNYASTVLRIQVNIKSLKTEHGTKTIIVKSHLDTIFGNAVSHGFPREIKMYTEILPEIQRLLQNAMPDTQYEFGAKHYYSKNEVPYILMLEDLSVKGFRLADRSVGLDLPHCELVMKTLARFHASSIPMFERNPQLFDIFRKGFFFETKAMEDFFTSVSTNRIETVIKVVEKWPKGGPELAQKLQCRSETLIEDFKTMYDSDENEYVVLTHGDLSINNIMFRYDDVTGQVEEVKFIDFQECTISSPVTDFYHFFYTSLRDDVRESHIKDLLKLYHQVFEETLKYLGYQYKTISFEALLKGFEEKSLLGLFYTIVFLPLLMTKRGVGVDLEGMAKNGDDTVTEESLSKESESVLKRLLPMFEKEGIF